LNVTKLFSAGIADFCYQAQMIQSIAKTQTEAQKIVQARTFVVSESSPFLKKFINQHALEPLFTNSWKGSSWLTQIRYGNYMVQLENRLQELTSLAISISVNDRN
jgi:hypothetical protein